MNEQSNNSKEKNKESLHRELSCDIVNAVRGSIVDICFERNALDDSILPDSLEWRSIHQSPPSLIARSTTSEIFETGIKAIDVLAPLELGGKAGLLEAPELEKRFYYQSFFKMLKLKNEETTIIYESG